ncbi:FAD-binding oxidoreductase [uncultured Tateyamaria sp.]|uniref:NAD(P)/FAD-dependent oxidoreductase n=1 Tax=uncultured Tateyamaria sp. TaxID=455651 RepID=UPI00262B0286|nr:FAD-dependent oxidoreductase [uncultured Tateyamaria sp.]
MKTIIIGGGIIGAAIAHQLRAQGSEVVVFDTGPGATAASFGWVNASFFLDEDHFRLRQAGIEAWRRSGVGVSWTGALCWEAQGAELEAHADRLAGLGYGVEVIEGDALRRSEPHVVLPERALRFDVEGVAEPLATAHRLLSGVKRISGVRIEAITYRGGAVTGVQTAHGHLAADRVVVAAGNGSPALLEPLGVALPMLRRPGVMVRTRAVPPVLSHVLVTPGGEVRQDAEGHIWTPTAANHQADDSTEVTRGLDDLAEIAVARLRALVPRRDIAWDHAMLADRPVPEDGLPVIGAVGPKGCFAAVMHSGVTLAAITGELMGALITDAALTNEQTALMAPYAPDRFQSG